MRREWSIAVLVLVAALSSAAGGAAQPLPLGPEVPVDGVTGSFVPCPLLAAGADGRVAIVWPRSWGGGELIRSRVVDADGVLGPIHRLSINDDYTQYGDLVAHGDGYRIVLQRGNVQRLQEFDNDGASRGAPRDVRRGTAVDLTPGPAGGFVATWQGLNGAWVQRLDDGGRPVASAYRLHRGPVIRVQTAHRADGGFVALWQPFDLAGDLYVDRGWLARRFDAAGRPMAPTFRAVPAPPAGRRVITLTTAVAADGALAIAWAREGGPDAASYVTLRTFAEDGAPLGPAVAVTTLDNAALEESFPQSLAWDDDKGHLLLLWAQYASPYVPDARGRAFARTGAPIGPSFPLASVASSGEPAIVCTRGARAAGAWVVTWIGSTVPPDEDDSVERRYLRRFE